RQRSELPDPRSPRTARRQPSQSPDRREARRMGASGAAAIRHGFCTGTRGKGVAMNSDELEGKLEELKGEAKEAAGKVTRNEELVEKGADQRAAGEDLEAYGKAKREVGEAVEDLGKEIKK